MGDQIRIGGLVIAADVMETIVRLAAEKVEGVAAVGTAADLTSAIGMLAAKKSPTAPAVGVREEGEGVRIAVHITAFFGYPFVALAEEVRATVAADVLSQVGAEVDGVDVFIDAITFPKE